MERKIVFGNWEACCFIIAAMCTQIFLNMPRVAVETAGTASWLLTIYTGILSFLLLIWMIRLYKPFTGKDLIDIAESAFGNIGRITIGLILVLYVGFIMSIVLREFSENMKTISLTRSPISFVTAFFVIGMIVGAYLGLETLVRFSSILVPAIAVGYVLIALGIFKFGHLDRLTPILGNGPEKVFITGSSKISIYSGILVLFWISPYIKKYGNLKIVGKTSMVISVLFMTSSAIIYLLVYPYPNALENFLPIYQLARLVGYGGFFQRVESIFLIFWATSAYIYLTLGLYFITNFYAKAFHLKYYKPMIIPFAIILFTASLIPDNLVTAIELEISYFRNLAWIIAFALPVFMFLIAGKVQKKKVLQKAGGKS